MHAQGTADLVLALDQHKLLGEEEMKVHVTEDGLLDRINKALDPAERPGRVHRRHADRAARRRAAGRRAGGDVRARPAALLRGRLPGARRPRRPRRDGADRHGRSGSRSTTTRDLARAREVACHC